MTRFAALSAPHPVFGAVTRAPAFALALLALWTCVAAAWFVSPLFPLQALRQLQAISGGWVTVTLVASAGIGLVQLVIVFGPGRQSLRDVGWHRTSLVPALVGTAALWALMHAGTMVWSLATGTSLRPAAAWAGSAAAALAPLLAQVFGTALMEETVFRGHLWPQLVLRLRTIATARVAWVAGLLLSQALFALLHVPVLGSQGLDAGAIGGTLVMLFVVGVVFALVYAATGNLWLAVGAHALGNAPTLLVEPQGPHPTLWLMGGLIAICAVAWARRRAKDRRRPSATVGHPAGSHAAVAPVPPLTAAR